MRAFAAQSLIRLWFAILLLSTSVQADDFVDLEHFERAEVIFDTVTTSAIAAADSEKKIVRNSSHQGNRCCQVDLSLSNREGYAGGEVELYHSYRCIDELRFWIRTTEINEIAICVEDGSGQFHQQRHIPIKADGVWQEVTTSMEEILAGEHWDGADDGVLHGFPETIQIRVYQEGFVNGSSGTFWIDDIQATFQEFESSTVKGCVLSQKSARAGYGLKLQHQWHGVPSGRSCQIEIRLVDETGDVVLEEYHQPPVPTMQWNGDVQYERTLVLSSDLSPGEYRIVSGLMQERGDVYLPVQASDDLVLFEPGSYVTGTFHITEDAPLPELPPRTLSLDDYQLTFSDEFNSKKPSISRRGAGTKWSSKLPYESFLENTTDFVDPKAGFPFIAKDGILQILARQKSDEKWESGQICSVNGFSGGFAQRFGYFEVRAKMPMGAGTLPSFALEFPAKEDGLTEVLAVFLEYYGENPHAISTTTMHLPNDGTIESYSEPFVIPDPLTEFHDYGILIEEDFLTHYFDGRVLRRIRTPEYLKTRLGITLQMAMHVPDEPHIAVESAVLEIDHVRIYAKQK